MSFTQEFGDWLAHAVTVELYLGSGFQGDAYGDPVPVEGVMLDDTRRLVRASDGNEVVSQTTLYGPPELAARFPLHSRVTLPDGRRCTVVQVATPREDEAEFVVVNLT